MTKQCGVCNKPRPKTEFGRNRAKKDGLQTICKDCNRLKNKEWYSKNTADKKQKTTEYRLKNRKINLLELEKVMDEYGCQKCDEIDHAALEFHHVSDKRFNISEAVYSGVPWETIQVELRKCVCLCANCHRKYHAKRFTLDGCLKCEV